MKLSNRIKFLLNEIHFTNKTTFCDIGCDHGIIGFELLKANSTLKVVFCDISASSLEKARKLCKDNKICSERIDFINCDGVPKEAKNTDVGLIFGLGGETIVDILSKNQKIQEFYLQPTTSVYELRKYLNDSNFTILKDYLFYDGSKYYNFIHIKKNKSPNHLNDEELLFGKDNIGRNDSEYLNFLKKEFANIRKVLAKTDGNVLKYNIDSDKIKIYHKKFKLIASRLKGDNDV
ncbi:MAG: SAM-dependent methyltransferase [Clostridia bacterium]|nr:SAM-dependent methyltransferase [Clostridia bacterium]